MGGEIYVFHWFWVLYDSKWPTDSAPNAVPQTGKTDLYGIWDIYITQEVRTFLFG